jgi:hypothetical protein
MMHALEEQPGYPVRREARELGRINWFRKDWDAEFGYY